MTRRHAAFFLNAALLLGPSLVRAQYAGAQVCSGCHAAKFASQSKTGHARALAAAKPGSPGQWAFGAGEQATTWVSQTGEETVVEHGLSFYTATKAMGITPGHVNSGDIVYRTFDPVGTALRCFRCHSTGPVKLAAQYRIEPSEMGIRCEACHGPGTAHVVSKGAPNSIQNPKRLNAGQINELCGACHRKASDLDDDTDWGNAWNVRHQPSYLHRAACFRNSDGALSCLTCHDPHEPLKTTAASYDAKCSACHRNATHKTAISGHTCVECHMPQVTTSPTLHFTNHWIGIYEQKGNKLTPSRRIAKTLKPAPATSEDKNFLIPADPSTLIPVYEKAVTEREKESGPDSRPLARASADLGRFLIETGQPAAALAPLRRAAAIDTKNNDSAVAADHESLAASLEAQGNTRGAIESYRQAATGSDPRVAARSFANLARLEPANALSDYANAVAAEGKTTGGDGRQLATLLHEYALALRSANDDAAAEPQLRRALAIEQKAAKPDAHLYTAILNTLGNLLEGRGQFDEAERLERTALKLAEEKFGPESAELALTCTNLADVLWNKRDLLGAGQLYRRAVAVDIALYGPDRPEAAADIANLGMLMKDAGQVPAADGLLRQALAIYEKTLGPESPQAKFVRENLNAPRR